MTATRAINTWGEALAGVAVGAALAWLAPVGPAAAADFVMKFGTATMNETQHQFIKFYKEDVEFIQDYVKCSEANRKGDSKTWNEYLKRHVQEHYAYLETVGIKKLLGLYTHPIVSW